MLLETGIHIAFIFLSLAFILAFYRFLTGPDLADRIVALDLIAMIIAGFIIVYMIYFDEPVYLDAVVIMALITFFGTVAFARYLEKGAGK